MQDRVGDIDAGGTRVFGDRREGRLWFREQGREFSNARCFRPVAHREGIGVEESGGAIRGAGLRADQGDRARAARPVGDHVDRILSHSPVRRQFATGHRDRSGARSRHQVLARDIHAFSLGAIFPRLGDLQLQMGIGPAALGLSVTGAALGVQVSLLMASSVLSRLGFRKVMFFGMLLMGIGEALAGLATSPYVFFGWFFLAGLAIGVVEVAVNVEADRVEALAGRRIMNRSHAFWSLGFFATGLLGAFVAQLGVPAGLHLSLTGLVSVALTLLFLARYQPAPIRGADHDGPPKLARPTRGIMVLVAFTLSAMLLEGALIDWSVIYMRDVFEESAFVNGLALTLGALGQFIIRFFADPVVDRHGAERVARVSLIALALGAGVVSFTPNSTLALIGFVFLGAGTAVIFPLAISAAAQRGDRSSPENVAALAQFSFVTFLLAPPLLGFVAENFGIRYSFGLALPLILGSWLTVGALSHAGRKA